MKKQIAVFLSIVSLHTVTCFAEGPKLVELFEYQLPLTVVQPNSDTPTQYTACTVASFTYEGIRYYRTVLSSPKLNSLIASASVGRGTFSPKQFAYEADLPGVVGNTVVEVKFFTRYTLDPKTLQVLSSEMSATTRDGKMIYHYVCGEKALTS